MVGTPKKQTALGNKQVNSLNASAIEKEAEPELVCTEKELDPSVEDDIKDGFFELKQKFKEQGESSIYISHIVLHEKHPIFSKMQIDTLKGMLTESSIIYL